MMLSRRTVVSALAAAPLLTGMSTRPNSDPTARLKSELDALINAAGVPGAGFALVAGKKAFAFGVGFADLLAGSRVSDRTLFHTASVSKVVTATTLMTLVDRRLIGLDEPIQPRLDFPVANPTHPGAPITLRQLLQHTSSISDDNYGPQFYTRGDAPTPLRDFLIQYLVPGGRLFAPERSFSRALPGTGWAYSNVGIALAGYLAGRVGVPLDALSRRAIFGPLRMQDSEWRLADIGTRPLAVGYARGAPGRAPAPLPPLGYPDWPAGMLRASARDMARFLSLFTARAGKTLSAQAIATMLRVDVFPGFSDTLDGQAVGWRRVKLDGRHVLSHTGSDPGVTAGIYLDPDNGTAAAVLMNLTADDRAKAARNDAAIRLMRAAGSTRA